MSGAAAQRAIAEAEAKGATIGGVGKAAGELVMSVVSLANMALIVFSLYGAYEKGDLRIIAVGLGFFALFTWALQRANSGLYPPMQIAIVLALVGLSFCLHFLYLPAGLCCMVILLLTKSSDLLPTTPGRPPPRGQKDENKRL